MGFFGRWFGKKQPTLPAQQAVLVYLDGAGLPAEVYAQYDLATIEDRLIEILEGNRLGDYDGNEFGPGETILFMVGPDAERLFAGIEQTLRDYPLCRGAQVVLRYGGVGARERELSL